MNACRSWGLLPVLANAVLRLHLRRAVNNSSCVLEGMNKPVLLQAVSYGQRSQDFLGNDNSLALLIFFSHYFYF